MDWSDTVVDREQGEVVGYLGNNERIADEAGRPVASSSTPIEDVRKDAIGATESGGTPVVDPAQAPSADAGKPSTPDNSGDPQKPASDIRPL